jgi:hypothetical protein
MYIPVTSNGVPFYSEGVVVRFFPSHGEEWVANFEPGWTNFTAVHELPNIHNLLVIANGACYVMDPDISKPIESFGIEYSAVFRAANNRYILQGSTRLTVIEKDGSHWATERISWDGLKVVQVEGNMVKGLAFDPMDNANAWPEFTYDIDSQVLTGGSYRDGAYKPGRGKQITIWILLVGLFLLFELIKGC